MISVVLVHAGQTQFGPFPSAFRNAGEDALRQKNGPLRLDDPETLLRAVRSAGRGRCAGETREYYGGPPALPLPR